MSTEQNIRFLIVTPSFNAPEFLDETIESVVSQKGAFSIDYHIQDGGSGEPTLKILRRWAERLQSDPESVRAERGFRFSWTSGSDRSMYDAIQQGFEALLRDNPAGHDERLVMAWINSDDLFTPNAFQTVAAFLSDHPGENWVTGLPCLVREDGCIADIRLEDCGYARARLAKGEYDGRRLPPVMQEGTFWTLDLWRRVGGLNTTLRLVGDWDLWRRMAQHARLINLRAVLAYHRRRSGQLSEDMNRYWAELDTTNATAKPGELPDELDRIALEGAWMAAWRTSLSLWVLSPMRYRRDGWIHCLSDCLVESWGRHAWGRAIIRAYRRLRGVPID